jgi:DNA-binding response OmpR family regulator
MPPAVLLAMSNALSETVRGQCLAAGADDYFDKSMDYRKLLIRVADLAS